MSFNKKYIYKITNLKNRKVYIGQSVNPKKRFEAHMVKKVKSVVENKKFNEDIQKYRKEDFSLEVLGFYENYNEMEEFFIKEFNAIENGYNVRKKSMSPPVLKGESHPCSKLTIEDVDIIKDELRNNLMSMSIITNLAKRFNLNTTTIDRINKGTIWFEENEIYPIKPNLDEMSKLIKREILKGVLNLREIAIKMNISHSRVKAINSGQNYKEDIYKYPLRANLDYNKAVSTISLIGE